MLKENFLSCRDPVPSIFQCLVLWNSPQIVILSCVNLLMMSLKLKQPQRNPFCSIVYNPWKTVLLPELSPTGAKHNTEFLKFDSIRKNWPSGSQPVFFLNLMLEHNNDYKPLYYSDISTLRCISIFLKFNSNLWRVRPYGKNKLLNGLSLSEDAGLPN